MSEFVVITGLSGAGRSQAADHLEDLGWFVIDNVPAALIPKLAELV
ncbi:MAG: RNase adapter protein RapZ, partial [Ilumatobacteraceae bacterium]